MQGVLLNTSLKSFFLCVLAAGVAAAAGNATAGKAVYDKSCKSCHGANGVANPAIAKSLKVEMRDLGSKEVLAQSDADIKKIITEGKGKKKPVKGVAGADLDNVIAYMRTLKK